MIEIVSRRRTVMQPSVQVSEFVSVFIEASKIFEFNIFFNRPPKSLKSTGAYRESTDVNL
jgi:hypothetical protein